VRRNALLLIAALAVAGAACTGTSPSGPPCTPPPAHAVTTFLEVSNATAAAGRMSVARLFGEVRSIGVLGCSSALIPASGTIDYSGGAFGPVGTLTIELIINSAASPTFGPLSRHYSFVMGSAGTITGGGCSVDLQWTVPVDYPTAAQSPVTWTPGSGCPGQ